MSNRNSFLFFFNNTITRIKTYLEKLFDAGSTLYVNSTRIKNQLFLNVRINVFHVLHCYATRKNSKVNWHTYPTLLELFTFSTINYQPLCCRKGKNWQDRKID